MIKKNLSPPLTDSFAQEAVWIRDSVTDHESFRPIYERYFKKIYLFIFHRVGDKDVAGDLTQQVFLNALTKVNQFQFRGLPVSAWLFRIAINQCNDFFKKTKRQRMVVLEDGMIGNLYEELTADQTLDEWRARLPEILQMLSSEDLQLIELRFFEGRSFKELGEILEITETNSKVRTYRILDKMKKLFLKRR
jgi:RNA polymerase sigma-70 factor (ECF subfamily)